jgi:hypothetical protein
MKPDKKADILSEAHVYDLQWRLALADGTTQQSRDNDRIELIVMKREHTKVLLRLEHNHYRPHFHVVYKRQYSASYAIDTLEKLAGSMPSRYETAALEWARDNKESLLATWKNLSAGKDVRELVVE